MADPKWSPPDDIDPEVVPLCRALNRIPGVKTFESCCGHGKETFSVWFYTRSWGALKWIAYSSAGCHSGYYGWRLIAMTDCCPQPILFKLESDCNGYQAYVGANAIAEVLNEHYK